MTVDEKIIKQIIQEVLLEMNWQDCNVPVITKNSTLQDWKVIVVLCLIGKLFLVVIIPLIETTGMKSNLTLRHRLKGVKTKSNRKSLVFSGNNLKGDKFCSIVSAQPNNSMDVRRKQLLSYLACLFALTLRGCGFRPRHLSRSAFLYFLFRFAHAAATRAARRFRRKRFRLAPDYLPDVKQRRQNDYCYYYVLKIHNL